MKMKYLSLAFLSLCMAVLTSSCGNEDLNPVSVFDGEVTKLNEFDAWLKKNYTDIYNISFNYRYSDKQTDQTYNVIPAKYEQSVALAKLVRHVWLDAYAEAMGADFMKTYTPREIQLIGSYEFNSNGSQVMGTAEGGLKIMLYGVNELDIDNPRINSDNPYASKYERPMDMNYWFFHTMHHEFCHILTQKKNYSTDYQTISAGKYHSADWINVADKDAAKEGFVTGYGSGEYNEDFAEMYSNYVTMTPAGWQMIIDQAGGEKSEGGIALNQKLTMIKEYFQNSWGVDLDHMRDIVLRRSAEAPSLDLRTLD